MNSEGDKSTASEGMDRRIAVPVMGFPIDGQTRCKHYHSSRDIIAIRFRCCGHYYPCHSCHEEAAGHVAELWRKDERNVKAVLCGVCSYEMSIWEYLSCQDHCPHCRSAFNPGCRNHHHLYFDF